MTRYLIDTNVLLRSAVNTSARNPAAARAIAILLAQGDDRSCLLSLCAAAQSSTSGLIPGRFRVRGTGHVRR